MEEVRSFSERRSYTLVSREPRPRCCRLRQQAIQQIGKLVPHCNLPAITRARRRIEPARSKQSDFDILWQHPAKGWPYALSKNVRITVLKYSGAFPHEHLVEFV